MSNIARMMQRATAGAGGAGLDVDEVFSTFLIDGNGSTQAINNGLDLSGEGGLVWIKNRDDAGSHHMLYDTVQPLISSKIARLRSSSANDADSGNNELSSFNSNGFTLGGSYNTNSSSYDYVSWSFRKAPKFMDIVTYTGTGSTQNISHNLGVVPAMMMVKSLGSNSRWNVYHKDASPNGTPQNGRMALNTVDPWGEYPTVGVFSGLWNNTAPTDSVFTVGSYNDTNASGYSFVAYLFAHNNNDGEFGPSADQDIIKCGSYTGNGSTTGPVIDLGFEPQFLMIKNASTSSDWTILDTMRGLDYSDNDPFLRPNLSNAEAAAFDCANPLATGFQLKATSVMFNTNNDTFIYMAIRRGPLAAPDDATKVFHPVKGGPDHNSVPFPTDFVITTTQGSGSDNWTLTRLLGETYMKTNGSNAEGSHNFQDIFADMTGMDWDTASWWSSSATNTVGWHWKRAPSYFDVCCYTGNQTSGRTVSHNLGAVPEMMWVKRRNAAADWKVYHSALGNTKHLNLNETIAAATDSSIWNNTTPTASVFTLGYDIKVNGNNDTFVAYLFATVAGVSKVGSFSHTNDGGDTNVDCGFSSGARFVLYKQYDSSGAWYVLDSVRGIVAGNDPALLLNSNAAEDSSYDQIDPLSSGFTIPSAGVGTGDYIFYAIA